jgi:hypothetical protein
VTPHREIIGWARIEQLRDEGVAARTLDAMIRAHGLDLPHQPGIYAAGTPANGITRWAVYCLGCSLERDRIVPTCQYGRWDGPRVLVDPEPVERVVKLAIVAAETAAAGAEPAESAA